MNLRDTRARIRIKDTSSTELKQRVKALGLNPEGKSMKELEVLISMAEFAKEHPNEEFPEQFDPMLAKESSKASKDWVDKLYKSSDYIIQSKVNGMRSVLRISEDGDVRMTSRSKSVKDFTFTPHQDNVLGFQSVRSPFSGKTVFDGELRSPVDKIDTGSTIAETPLQCVVALVHMNTKDSLKIQREVGSLVYYAFDILYYNGDNVQDLSYEERDKLMRSALGMLKESNPILPIYTPKTWYDFESAYDVFKQWVDLGHEGLVVKSRKGKYQQGKRSADWTKLKGTITVDGFITGVVPSSKEKSLKDYIGGFKVSAYVDGVITEIAAISNIPMDIRTDATITVDGEPQLNPEYLNKCVEMVGQEFNKSGRLGSARINEWRPDKSPEDCKLTAEDIKTKDWSVYNDISADTD